MPGPIWLRVLVALALVAVVWVAGTHGTVHEASAQEPSAARAIRQGEAADLASNYDQAVEIYSAALRADSLAPSDRRALLRKRGSAYEWAKKYAEAEADFTAALQIEPSDSQLYMRRGFFYQRRGRHDEALADFAAGKQVNPADPWLAFGEGEVHSTRKAHQAAIVAYSEAISLDPKLMRVYLRRGSAYNYENMFAQARADYDHVLANHESGGRDTKFVHEREIGLAYLGRGYASNHLEDYRRAKQDFDKVLRLVPNSANALRWRGIAHEHLGEPARALEDYRAALAVFKTDAWLSERVRLLEGR